MPPQLPPPQSYPHVQEITDWPTRQTITLLWQRVTKLAADLASAQTTITQQAASITALQSALSSTSKVAQEALITAGQATETEGGSGGTPGGGGAVGCPDDGLGAQGCAQRGADGHVAPGTPLTAITAGQIVCGTAAEFPALVAPTANQLDRDANQAELLLRIIWHLNLAGFTAGRQKNPSGVISGDKLTVQIAGAFIAYDVFQGVDFGTFLPTHMIKVCPASYIPEPGTPD